MIPLTMNFEAASTEQRDSRASKLTMSFFNYKQLLYYGSTVVIAAEI